MNISDLVKISNISFSSLEELKTSPLYDGDKASVLRQSIINPWINTYNNNTADWKEKLELYGTTINNIIDVLKSLNLDGLISNLNYNDLSNKPSINNVVLEGNLNIEQLGTYSKLNIDNLLNKYVLIDSDKTNNSLTTSSYFYIQENDFAYVMPFNKVKTAITNGYVPNSTFEQYQSDVKNNYVNIALSGYGEKEELSSLDYFYFVENNQPYRINYNTLLNNFNRNSNQNFVKRDLSQYDPITNSVLNVLDKMIYLYDSTNGLSYRTTALNLIHIAQADVVKEDISASYPTLTYDGLKTLLSEDEAQIYIKSTNSVNPKSYSCSVSTLKNLLKNEIIVKERQYKKVTLVHLEHDDTYLTMQTDLEEGIDMSDASSEMKQQIINGVSGSSKAAFITDNVELNIYDNGKRYFNKVKGAGYMSDFTVVDAGHEIFSVDKTDVIFKFDLSTLGFPDRDEDLSDLVMVLEYKVLG